MVLSPTICIWFLPVVLALLVPVSEAWLQPLDNQLLRLRGSLSPPPPHFLALCLSRFGFCLGSLMLLLPRGAPASMDKGCQSPLQTHFLCVTHPADSELPGTFLHPPGSASILAHFWKFVPQGWPWLPPRLALALPSPGCFSWGLAPPLWPDPSPGSGLTLGLVLLHVCVSHPAYTACLVLGSGNPMVCHQAQDGAPSSPLCRLKMASHPDPEVGGSPALCA